MLANRLLLKRNSLVPTAGLIAHYTMDNISGATLIDQMGNYNGAINGAVQTAGKFGQALLFNGSSDFVDCGSLAGSTLVGDFTISLWIKTSESDDGVYLAKYNSVPSFFEIGRATVGSCFYVRHANSGGADMLLKDPATTESYGSNFVNVVMLRSGSTTSIIVNNVTKAATTTTRTTASSGHNLQIGARSFPGAREFGQGAIDQIRIYNRALSTAEIAQLYNEVA